MIQMVVLMQSKIKPSELSVLVAKRLTDTGISLAVMPLTENRMYLLGTDTAYFPFGSLE